MVLSKSGRGVTRASLFHRTDSGGLGFQEPAWVLLVLLSHACSLVCVTLLSVVQGTLWPDFPVSFGPRASPGRAQCSHFRPSLPSVLFGPDLHVLYGCLTCDLSNSQHISTSHAPRLLIRYDKDSCSQAWKDKAREQPAPGQAHGEPSINVT